MSSELLPTGEIEEKKEWGRETRGNWKEERVRERDKGKFKRRKSEGEREGEVDKERER